MTMSKNSIINILEDYFQNLERTDFSSTSSTTNAIIEIHKAIENNETSNIVSDIDLYNVADIDKKVDECKARLCSLNKTLSIMMQPISYFLSEITDNMQQHSNTDKGYIFAAYNPVSNQVELVLADGGISIYGSYINANKFIDDINNSDVLAVEKAKEGYSTKDRPEAENRGYGLSSNIKMITHGLKGDLAIMSGNALYISSINKLVELPKQLDWKGTLILATIPADMPPTFNFYDYI